MAFFGVLGYELDPTTLAADDRRAIADQVAFYKANRELFQRGRFVRLRSPFEDGGNQTAWMVVAPDRSRAVVGYYQVLNRPVPAADHLRLRGLDPGTLYRVTGWPDVEDPLVRANAGERGGDELMGVGPVARRRSPRGRAVGRLPGLAVRARGRLGSGWTAAKRVSWCVPSPVYGPDRSTPDRSGPYSTDATVLMRPARRRCPKSICMRLGDGP